MGGGEGVRVGVGEGGAVVGSGVPSLRHSLTAHSLSFIRASLPPLPVPEFCGIVGCKASPPLVVTPLSKRYVSLWF